MIAMKKLPLSTQIFIALILAILAGIALASHPSLATTYIKPFGTIFLNLVKWIVGPLVFFSIMADVISMRDIRKVGSIGVKTLVYYLCTTAFAITIGLCFANLFRAFFPVLQTSDLSYEASASVNFMDTLIGIFPSNFIAPFASANMLQIIVASLLIGFALLLLGGENAGDFRAVEILNDIFLKAMEMIVQLSPVGVFCLLCPVVAENGPSVLGALAKVLLVAYIGYIVHAVVVYSLSVKLAADMSPLTFFRGMLPQFCHMDTPIFQQRFRRALCQRFALTLEKLVVLPQGETAGILSVISFAEETLAALCHAPSAAGTNAHY